MSQPTSFFWLSRKLSLTTRRMRFLATALFTARFPTIIPTRACSLWLDRQRTVKHGWLTLSGSLNTLSNSALVNSRWLRGKFNILVKIKSYGINLLRPFALRRLSTFRPSIVAIRARKPCFLLRGITLGWNVLFIINGFRYLVQNQGANHKDDLGVCQMQSSSA